MGGCCQPLPNPPPLPSPLALRRLLAPHGTDEHWDAQAVGAIVERLVDEYRKEEREEFRGEEHQYPALERLAERAVGGGWSGALLRRLVGAYFARGK